MAKTDRHRPKKIRPAFLIIAGIALAGFGLIAGIAFDRATRPPAEGAPAIPVVRSAPKQFSPPPFLSDRLTERGAPPELEKPSGEPVRAWASDVSAPLVAFAMPPASTSHRHVIAIVIDDMGL